MIHLSLTMLALMLLLGLLVGMLLVCLLAARITRKHHHQDW